MKIELESLEDEINNLEEIYEKKFCDKTISNYVFQENRVTLKSEFYCLKSLLNDLDVFELVPGEDLEHLKGRFLAFIDDLCRLRNYPEAVYRLVDSKVQKAVLYLL
jgi:hypothetical protein